MTVTTERLVASHPSEVTETPEIFYPSSDGEPLAETHQHVLAILMAFAILRLYLQEQPAVVFANQFFYYIENNPKARVAPDVMVVFNIPKKLYGNYKLWEGKQAPAIIFEVTSAGTKETDWSFKKTLYEQLGVREYWLFDPYGEWITEQLKGYRLNEEGMYKPITDSCSQVLQLRLEADEYLISFYRLDNGEKLLTPEELFLAALEANQRAEQEKVKVEEAQLLAEEAQLLAQQEKAKAVEAELIAQQEKARADRLAEKLRQLGVEVD